MDDFFRLNGSQFMLDYMTRLSKFLGESDLYCFARTCTLFYNALHERIPYNVHVSKDSFQRLDVLDYLQTERVISYYSCDSFQLPHNLQDHTQCATHARWMLENLYTEPERILHFVVSHDCKEMVTPVLNCINQLYPLDDNISVYLPDVKSEEMWDILSDLEIGISINTIADWTDTRSIRMVVLKWQEIVQTEISFFTKPIAINNLIGSWLQLPKSNWKSHALSKAYIQLQDIGLLSKRVCDRMTCWERTHFYAEHCECNMRSRHEIKPHTRKRLKRM